VQKFNSQKGQFSYGRFCDAAIGYIEN